jgi:oxygen-independent coproporphyrinogen-3 oxidase
MQNLDTWETYAAAIEQGDLPLGRAYRPTDRERLIRELVLQLKRGAVRPEYFAVKFGVDIRATFADAWRSIARDGWLAEDRADRVALTRDGLLRVDTLLPRFFLEEHRGVRYT